MKQIRINIITPFETETFMRQCPATFENEGIHFFENNQSDQKWDMVVVYEGVAKVQEIKCKKGGLLFISGEPPLSRWYSDKFLQQFDHIISSHRSMNHPDNHLSQQSLPWHFGLSYETKKFNFNYNDLVDMQPPVKTRRMSFITSNKQMLPGHRQRMKFLEAVDRKFAGAIDFYGLGIKAVDDKAEALIPYKFSISIENSAIDNYWTEKFADPLLGFTMPVYSGCKNISSYFGEGGFVGIDINDIKGSLKKVEYLLANSEQVYSKNFENILKARTMILNKYNLFSVLKNFYFTYLQDDSIELGRALIKPAVMFRDYKPRMNMLRLKRFILKHC